MVSFAIQTNNDSKVTQFIYDSLIRQESILTFFKMQIVIINTQPKTIYALFDVDILLPRLYLGSAFFILLGLMIDRYWIAYFGAITLPIIYFFYTRYLYYLVFKLGLRKKGNYKGPIKLLTDQKAMGAIVQWKMKS